MAFADTFGSIGAVTELLATRLATPFTSVSVVEVGRPEAAAGTSSTAGPKFNIFLYQVEFDASLKNYPIDSGQPPPLWMVLHYLLTAYDSGRESDSAEAHRLLGEGLAVLQQLNFLDSIPENREPLKITFDSADVDMLSRVMQGTDERYRVSVGFQVRPVLIAPQSQPGYSLPVKSVGPPADQGVVVVPSLGPHLEAIDPGRFEAGADIRLTGTDLADVYEVCFGSVCYAVTAATDRTLRTAVPADTELLSPGGYPVTAVRVLPSGRRYSSNAQLGHLVPTLHGATPGSLSSNGAGNLFGDLTLDGRRLGGPQDMIFVAFYRGGEVVLVLEAEGDAAQTSLTVSVSAAQALPSASYYVVLRVNGAQAPHAPPVDWTT